MGLELLFSTILSEALNQKIKIHSLKSLSGGCINNAMRAETELGYFFIKSNSSENYKMFETEAKGLELLRKTGVIHVPQVITYGRSDNLSYLMLDYVEEGRRINNYWEDFGVSMALLHQTSSETNGLEYDNFIGPLPQVNSPQISWISFYIENRLEIQKKLALKNGKIDSSISDRLEKLYIKLPHLLQEEKSSLLHGDLWSGNVMVDKDGRATIIDPAVFYGHREAELAFTTLFGGFDRKFYESYNETYPLVKGYQERFDLYNLYPLLVHVNLFGGGYLGALSSILKKYN